MFPNGDILDPTKDNIFSVTVNGQTCIAYRVSIYDMNNMLIVNENQRVDLEETKYNGDTIDYTLEKGILEAGNEYKWSIAMYGNDVDGTLKSGIVTSTNHNFETGDMVYVKTTASDFSDFTPYYVGKFTKDTFALYGYLEGARNDSGRLGESASSSTNITVSSVGISEQCIFKAYSDIVLTLDSKRIDNYIFKFIPTYTQNEGLIINSFEVEYYSDFNATPISSGKMYSSKLEYEIDGLLSGHTYYVRFSVINSMGQKAQTDYIPFDVSYATTSLGVQPTVYNNSENSCIDVEWDGITQIAGSVTGGDYEYVDNYRYVGNTALSLSAGSSLKYKNIECLEGASLPMFNWEPKSSEWKGTIFRMDNSETGDYIELKYEDGVFYLNTNGEEKIVHEEKVIEGMSFYIGIEDDELYMYPIDMTYLQQFTAPGLNTPIRLKDLGGENV